MPVRYRLLFFIPDIGVGNYDSVQVGGNAAPADGIFKCILDSRRGEYVVKLFPICSGNSVG